jgi:hypothetical protein
LPSGSSNDSRYSAEERCEWLRSFVDRSEYHIGPIVEVIAEPALVTTVEFADGRRVWSMTYRQAGNGNPDAASTSTKQTCIIAMPDGAYLAMTAANNFAGEIDLVRMAASIGRAAGIGSSETSAVAADTCASCGATGGPELKRCSRCKMVLYCSHQCQLDHFPGHKKACKTAARRRLAEEQESG